MSAKALLYLHGLGSSGDSDTGRFLHSRFSQQWTIYRPSYRPQFLHESAQMIDALLEEIRSKHAVIGLLGSSMGGWQALHALHRHPDLVVTALNPVIDPNVLRRAADQEDVDHSSGEPLPWPELVAENFPAVPTQALPAAHLRLLLGEADDVVPATPSLEICRQQGWSHRVFEWGHRAELDDRFAQEMEQLMQRAELAVSGAKA